MLVLPKRLRDELHLESGDTMELELELEGDRVTLRPISSASPLRREQGVWVFRGGGHVSAAATDKVLRETRDFGNRGSR